jgi:hypothetical protein
MKKIPTVAGLTSRHGGRNCTMHINAGAKRRDEQSFMKDFRGLLRTALIPKFVRKILEQLRYGCSKTALLPEYRTVNI